MQDIDDGHDGFLGQFEHIASVFDNRFSFEVYLRLLVV